MRLRYIDRRHVCLALGGAAAAWPLAARGQQPAVPTIGYLGARSSETDTHLVALFREGLQEQGFVDGRNVAIEYRFADGRYDRLPALAAELVRRRVAVICSMGGSPTAKAAMAATTTTPIVFVIGADPVRAGLVASFNRPGGNVTGFTTTFFELAQKRIGLLRELAPAGRTIVVLANPANSLSFSEELEGVRSAAQSVGFELRVMHTGSDAEIEAVFVELMRARPDALFVTTDSFLATRARKLADLAARLAAPALFYRREFAVAGGLISYGPNAAESYRGAGNYAGRILKGAHPSDLPVQRPTRYELVINLKTAKALGIELPPMLLARADEVIE